MRRLLPKTLMGQMLLAVAAVLLVGQAASLAAIYRIGTQRAEAALVQSLAFQLATRPAADPAATRGGGRFRRPLAQDRMRQALSDPALRERLRDPAREAAVEDVLTQNGVDFASVVVLVRPPPPRVGQESDAAPRRLRGRGQGRGGMAVAGMQAQAGGDWVFASAPLPQARPGALSAVLWQTVLLYLVLVGGLAVLLRRITRPLAALTHHVGGFDGSTADRPALLPQGPDDTRRLIAAHNTMERRIAALLDEKDVMLGAIGHDLKTPLAALRVRIESVENDAERAVMAEGVADIAATLDDILSLARAGRPSDPLERTDLTALVASIVAEYEDMGRDVRLVETERIAIPLRATWLRRALRNLISNALRYGRQARIRLTREGEEAVIRIADTGPGIPDGRIGDMLEPFRRGEASRNRATGGAGLGLTLARTIVEQHGGSLRLVNRIAENGHIAGLLAEIRLPLQSPAR